MSQNRRDDRRAVVGGTRRNFALLLPGVCNARSACGAGRYSGQKSPKRVLK